METLGVLIICLSVVQMAFLGHMLGLYDAKIDFLF